ncbi:MAG: ATP-binding protein [Bacteroidales bacterium]|nr:ATP-binding protein [Bacteroidales bacterium]
MAYYTRKIDERLLTWRNDPKHKPLLVRGARQVGKSTAVRKLGETFRYFVEINLEKQPSLKTLFPENIDVKKTCSDLSATVGIPIIPGETLLFIDEIQDCIPAIMSLRYFKEDYPELHVIAAGSLLEFALEEIPSFAVGRIRSLYMYPFSFEEFMSAQGLDLQLDAVRRASPNQPLFEPLHKQLTNQVRSFMLVGGMPEAVSTWVETHDYLACARVHNDIMDTYQDDFYKYKKRISPELLTKVLRSVARQCGTKFIYNRADEESRNEKVKQALHKLSLAGLVTPVTHTTADGIPLGAQVNERSIKYLFLDTGLLLTWQGIPASDILLSSDIDLVNKGLVAEVLAGLEMIKNKDCFQRAEMFYWQHESKNGNAEVDYLGVYGGIVLPIEVKASTKGTMQSLYLFMHKKRLHAAVRTSLENFGAYDYIDPQPEKDDISSIRHIDVYPLYALSNLFRN